VKVERIRRCINIELERMCVAHSAAQGLGMCGEVRVAFSRGWTRPRWLHSLCRAPC
jgi:hypothetical protein